LIAIDKVRKEKSIQKYLFVFLIMITMIIFFGFFASHFEDRYLSGFLPFMFILTGLGLDIVAGWISKYSKVIAMAIITILILTSMYQMYQHSDAIIEDKLESYKELKETGKWIRENIPVGANISSSAITELTYYGRHAVYSFKENLSAQLEFTSKQKPAYAVLTNWEGAPDWVFPYFTSNQTLFVPVHQDISTYKGQKMFAVVFKTNDLNLT
jgi:hypothetical protein